MELSEIKTLAQRNTRELLSRSKSFPLLSKEEQLSLYMDLYEAEKNKHVEQMAVSNQMATGKTGGASDLIDKNRYDNKRIDEAGNIAKTFMEGVDFPKFVKDLLKGVFDANMAVVIGQMDEYIKLMKAATADVSKFVNAIDAAASFGYLAENSNDDFGLGEDDDGNQTLVGKDGEVLATALPNGKMADVGDNELKAKIMDAKIKMAQEQRAILRETILMGVTRLVVERGTVKAGVIFDIKASEKIDLKDKAAKKDASSSSKSISGGGGFLGKIFGGPSGGYTSSDQHSTISISSGKATNSSDLKAQVTGSVEIIFKSDYFKLDNFKDMYGQIKSDSAGTTKETQNVAQGAPRK